MDLYSIDKQFFIFLNREHSAFMDRIMYDIRDMLLWVPLILLSIFIFSAKFKNKLRPRSLTKVVILSILIVLQIVLCVVILPHIFDPFIQRERPVYDADILQSVNLSFTYPEKVADFYSAKACAVAAIAFFFISFYETPKWLKITLLLWTILISYNRIYIGAQYPFNIFISNLLGIGIGLFASRCSQFVKTSVLALD